MIPTPARAVPCRPGAVPGPGPRRCSGGDDDGPGRQSSAAPAADGGAPGIATLAESAVVGKLARVRRERLRTRTLPRSSTRGSTRRTSGATIPRSDFGDAFPGFTKGAATLALATSGLMSNAEVGAGSRG